MKQGIKNIILSRLGELKIIIEDYYHQGVHVLDIISSYYTVNKTEIKSVVVHFTINVQSIDINVGAFFSAIQEVDNIQVTIFAKSATLKENSPQSKQRDIRILEELNAFTDTNIKFSPLPGSLIPNQHSISYKIIPFKKIESQEQLSRFFIESSTCILLDFVKKTKPNGIVSKISTSKTERHFINSAANFYKDISNFEWLIISNLIPILTRCELSYFFENTASHKSFKKDVRKTISVQLLKQLEQKHSLYFWFIFSLFLRGNLSSIFDKRAELKPNDIINFFNSANSYSRNLSNGLYEIVKNSLQHSKGKKSVIGARIRDKEEIKMEMCLIDISEFGLRENLNHTLLKIQKTLGQSNKFLSQTINNDVELLQEQKLKAIFDNNNFNLIYSEAMHMSHFGIEEFKKTLKKLDGYFQVSSSFQGDCESYPKRKFRYHSGTIYNLSIPLKYDYTQLDSIETVSTWNPEASIYKDLGSFNIRQNTLTKREKIYAQIIDCSDFFSKDNYYDGSDLIRFISSKTKASGLGIGNTIVYNIPKNVLLQAKRIFKYYIQSNESKGNTLFHYLFSYEKVVYEDIDFKGKIHSAYVFLEGRLIECEMHNNSFKIFKTKDCNNIETQNISYLPFDLILKNGGKTLFEENIEALLNTPSSDDKYIGYRLKGTHFKYGSMVHINDFRYASKLFETSYFINNIGFIIAKILHQNEYTTISNSGELSLNDNQKLRLIGYGKYSKNLLQQVDTFLKDIYSVKSPIDLRFLDQNDKNEIVLLSGELELNSIKEYKHVIIVPISLTLSTSAKIYKYLSKELSIDSKNLSQRIINPLIIANKNLELEEKITSFEKEFGWMDIDLDNKTINTQILDDPVKDVKLTNYFCLLIKSEWQYANNCKWCFSPNDYNLFNTTSDKTIYLQKPNSTGVSPKDALIVQKHFNENPSTIHNFQSNKNISLTEDCHSYGHRVHRHSHYIHYIKSIIFFNTYKTEISNWLNEVQKIIKTSLSTILVTPLTDEENNFYFAQFVNNVLFYNKAKIISFEIDKSKRNINNLVYYQEEILSAEQIIYVDDFIQSGRTFFSINNFVKACFDKDDTFKSFDYIINLINISSANELRNVYSQLAINEPNESPDSVKKKMFSFFHLKLSAFKHNCPICTLRTKYLNLADDSSTEALKNFFYAKASKLYYKQLHPGITSKDKSEPVENNSFEFEQRFNISQGFFKLNIQNYYHQLISADENFFNVILENESNPDVLVSKLIDSFKEYPHSWDEKTKIEIGRISDEDLIINHIKVLRQEPFLNVLPIQKIVYLIVKTKFLQYLNFLNEYISTDKTGNSIKPIDILIKLQKNHSELPDAIDSFRFYIKYCSFLNIDYLIHYEVLTQLFGILDKYDQHIKKIKETLSEIELTEQLERLDLSSFPYYYSAWVKVLIKENEAFGLRLAENLKKIRNNYQVTESGNTKDRIIATLMIENTYLIKKGVKILSKQIPDKILFNNGRLKKYSEVFDETNKNEINLDNYRLNFFHRYLDFVFEKENECYNQINKTDLNDLIQRLVYLYKILKLNKLENLEDVLNGVSKNINWILNKPYELFHKNNSILSKTPSVINDNYYYQIFLNANTKKSENQNLGLIVNQSAQKFPFTNSLPIKTFLNGFHLYNQRYARKKYANPAITILNFKEYEEGWKCSHGEPKLLSNSLESFDLTENPDFENLYNEIKKESIYNEHSQLTIIRINQNKFKKDKVSYHPLAVIIIGRPKKDTPIVIERFALFFSLLNPLIKKLWSYSQTPAFEAYLKKTNSIADADSGSHGYNTLMDNIRDYTQTLEITNKEFAIDTLFTLMDYVKNLNEKFEKFGKYNNISSKITYNEETFLLSINKLTNEIEIIENLLKYNFNKVIQPRVDNIFVPFGFTTLIIYELLKNAVNHRDKESTYKSEIRILISDKSLTLEVFNACIPSKVEELKLEWVVKEQKTKKGLSQLNSINSFLNDEGLNSFRFSALENNKKIQFIYQIPLKNG